MKTRIQRKSCCAEKWCWETATVFAVVGIITCRHYSLLLYLEINVPGHFKEPLLTPKGKLKLSLQSLFIKKKRKLKLQSRNDLNANTLLWVWSHCTLAISRHSEKQILQILLDKDWCGHPLWIHGFSNGFSVGGFYGGELALKVVKYDVSFFEGDREKCPPQCCACPFPLTSPAI